MGEQRRVQFMGEQSRVQFMGEQSSVDSSKEREIRCLLISRKDSYTGKSNPSMEKIRNYVQFILK